MALPDYYKILKISPNASADEIKKAYKEQALKYHPDVFDHEKAIETFQLVNTAYRTLIDPTLRKRYDFQMKYPDSVATQVSDARKRHPADRDYYYRKAYHPKQASPSKSIFNFRKINTFFFISILAILGVGIVFGTIDLITNFRYGGLLFSVLALVIIWRGMSIIKREK